MNEQEEFDRTFAKQLKVNYFINLNRYFKAVRDNFHGIRSSEAREDGFLQKIERHPALGLNCASVDRWRLVLLCMTVESFDEHFIEQSPDFDVSSLMHHMNQVLSNCLEDRNLLLELSSDKCRSEARHSFMDKFEQALKDPNRFFILKEIPEKFPALAASIFDFTVAQYRTAQT